MTSNYLLQIICPGMFNEDFNIDYHYVYKFFIGNY